MIIVLVVIVFIIFLTPFFIIFRHKNTVCQKWEKEDIWDKTKKRLCEAETLKDYLLVVFK